MAAQDTGLTTIDEADIAKHLATAEALVNRTIVMEEDAGRQTALAGTGRRFVSTVRTAGTRRTREVSLKDSLHAVDADDPTLSIAQHSVLVRARRGIQIALAVADTFAEGSDLESLRQRNQRTPLDGDDAERFRALTAASSYVAAFAFSAYLARVIEGSDETVAEPDEPEIAFETPQDALKGLLAGLDAAVRKAKDDKQLTAIVHEYAGVCLEELLKRRGRFSGLGPFETAHIRIDRDDFTLDGFDVAPGQKRQKLVMSFKKPTDIVGNHLAKAQAIKTAKMLMAYDFERQMNPFVDLGGFLFTFIGDGMPGTGKTMLIQMMAGMINGYCEIAGYPFHYENFGVDQISSYQGKSGQNAKQFVENVTSPRSIGFGTIDDIDQVAAKRSDDRASAGQHEVTAVLMEAFAGATTVVRGNCTFGMFSNYPENVDDALRQRAGARWLVDGPQTENDYIDIVAILLGKNHDIPVGDHDLFTDQEIKRAVSQAYEKHDRPSEEGLIKVFERYRAEHGGFDDLKDVGTYLHMIKEAEPRFTGRAVKNITDAVKMRAMDVELPDEWFEDADTFMHQPYDRKTEMIRSLRGEITMEMIVQEVNRYADSEFRYSDRSDQAAVEDMLRQARLRERAEARMRRMREEGTWAS